jgi:hypothetical protein
MWTSVSPLWEDQAKRKQEMGGGAASGGVTGGRTASEGMPRGGTASGSVIDGGAASGSVSDGRAGDGMWARFWGQYGGPSPSVQAASAGRGRVVFRGLHSSTFSAHVTTSCVLH